MWWCSLAFAVQDPLAYSSLGALDPSAPVTIDTGTLVLSAGLLQVTGVLGPGGEAVFTFDEVLLDQPVTVVGPAPLVILSHGALTLAAPLDLSAAARVPGPGGHDGGTPGQRGAGDGGGGGDGAQGNPGGGGGHGGSGGRAGYVAVGLASGFGGGTCCDPEQRLEGGSGGGGGESGGGAGGGALELGALGRLDVTVAGAILVNGGVAPSARMPGGGGAGGAIVLHGRGGHVAGPLAARGGDGVDGDNGSGGGGGGRVVLRGVLSVTGAVDVAGGDEGAGVFYAGRHGTGGTVLIALGLDLDGDDVEARLDCDDRDPLVSPGAEEVPCNGLDDDCDPATDDGDCAPPGDSADSADTGARPTDPTDPGETEDPPPDPDPTGGDLSLKDPGCRCAGAAGRSPWGWLLAGVAAAAQRRARSRISSGASRK